MGGHQALAQSPAAPDVTAGADAKALIFDWSPVAGATHYRVFGDANGDTDGDGLPEYRQIGRDIRARRTQAIVKIGIHRLQWPAARYIVSACNAAGCTESAPISVQDLMLDTIAYFKASNTEAGDQFGSVVALSADGKTLAVSAPQEDGGGTGVNPRRSGNLAIDSGAVYVFHRIERHWIRSAYLKPSVIQPGALSGGGSDNERRMLSVSGDGTFVAVGAPSFDSLTGVTDAGAVHVYRKAHRGWRLHTTLQLPDARPSDRFGYEVDLSENARLLLVRTQRTTEQGGFGESYIYRRDGSQWQLTTILPPPAPDHVCLSGKLSGDGKTLILGCGVPDVDRLLFQLVRLQRHGDQWVHVATLPVADARGWDEQPFAIDRSASVIAARITYFDFRPTEGVRVLTWNGTAWDIEVTIINDPFSQTGTYGRGLAFSGNGDVLAFGNFRSALDGAGVLPELFGGSSPDGAVLFYARAGDYPRFQWAKAPNPDAEDSFGRSIAFDHSGNTVAIGASGEASKSRGIDADQVDDSMPDAGAAYLY